LALETWDYARQRGAEVLGEIAGYGAASDPHHLTQPEPVGAAAWRTMTQACQAAGVGPEQIGYVNAHGTGTPLNDSAEAQAINRWGGDSVASIPVSSTKASVGHLLGAAGAVEAVICLMALREGWLPPTATLQTPDPVCWFPLVQKPTNVTIQYAMTNSFGFGGANASLVLKRWE
jgi:3-oxoacyl-[acyl-carrier-protein] synthase II